MAPAVRIFRKFRAADGRIKVTTAIGVLALAAATAAFGILPALANHDAKKALVEPDPLNYGGGSGGCAAAGSEAAYELWINNPKPGVTPYEGPDPDKTVFTLTVTEDDLYFGFAVEEGSSMGAFDVTVNGGQKSLQYNYKTKLHPVPADNNLHAPTKGKSLYNLSHVNICYDVRPPADVSGVKYHDRDIDGLQDNTTDEPGLGGWTIAALDSNGGVAGTDLTSSSDGSYTIADLAPGTYTICEQINSAGLPSPVPAGVSWSWTQSDLEDSTWGADCDQFNPTEGEDVYLPVGHTVTIEADVSGVDFGNHRQATIDCSATEGAIELSLGGGNEPLATVTFPADCQSGEGENPVFTTSFDLGLSTDTSDDWTQFVVFGGDPTSTQVLTQTIEWAPETAVYNADNQLMVDTTKVLLDLSGTSLVDVTFCHTDSALPDSDTPQCLDSRTIAEGGDVPADHIQVTEHYRLLGDPGNFR